MHPYLNAWPPAPGAPSPKGPPSVSSWSGSGTDGPRRPFIGITETAADCVAARVVLDKDPLRQLYSNMMTNQLRVLRTDNSWSQAELARRLGVSRQTVNALERGKYHPSLPLAFKIARLFDSAIEDVFIAEIELNKGATNGHAWIEGG